MNIDQVLEKLKPWRKKHEKTFWTPIVEEGDGANQDSKFSGNPWIDKETVWPVCKNCNLQMQFLLQLNLDKLPDELESKHGSGLLQLFYCTREKCEGIGGWDPFEDKVSCVRVVKPVGEYNPSDKKDPQEEDYPALKVIGWQKGVNLPSASEHEQLGLKYTYSKDGPTIVKCEELNFKEACQEDGELAETIGSSTDGDKLSGWPFWVQNVGYPDCTICGARMINLFQLDSEDNIPYMFGDSGCGHITQCPVHKGIVAFSWDCA